MSSSGEIKKLKKKIVPLLKQHGVRKAGIFGSYARGEAGKRSDIDILVKLKPGTSLLDVIVLEGKIEKKIKKKAELVTYDSIHPFLKERILEEEVRIL